MTEPSQKHAEQLNSMKRDAARGRLSRRAFIQAALAVWLSVPAGLVDGLPVGMMIVGKRFDDSTVLKIAGLGVKVTRVPVLPAAFLTAFSGASGTPSAKAMKCSCPPRQMVSSSRIESAFTTYRPARRKCPKASSNLPAARK